MNRRSFLSGVSTIALATALPKSSLGGNPCVDMPIPNNNNIVTVFDGDGVMMMSIQKGRSIISGQMLRSLSSLRDEPKEFHKAVDRCFEINQENLNEID